MAGLSASQAHLLHFLFEWAAIALGVQLYRLQRARTSSGGMLEPGSYAVVMGCILGAAIGNKLVFWIEYPHLWAAYGASAGQWMAGQSVVGGLLGGLLGVELAKAVTHGRTSTGDNFVLPLMIGIAVGRIGCFLAGLSDATYGVASTVPWAVDFGDGVKRHPTQLYDMAFALGWGALLRHLAPRWHRKSGLTFKLFLAGYLAWRLGVDALKPVPFAYIAGLSGVQITCLAALLCYLPFVIRQIIVPTTEARPA